MDRPNVLMLTSDASLVSLCCEEFGDRVEVDVCRMPDDVRPRLTRRRADAFVADFRGTLDGGHFGDRLLEDIQLDFEPRMIVLLTDADCPEPLERRVACNPIVHFRGDIPAMDIANALLEGLGLKTPPEAASRETSVVEESAEPVAVLEGVTRRFETKAPQLRQMLDDLSIAAVHNVTILLIGETGAGKTFLSQLIHEASPRRNEPFIPIACGALPRELIESEMFGHVKGAFTSAHADKEGKFIAAGGGTILLDEIDVLGPEQQVKLLRVIESGEFEPVGSNKTLKSRARLIVASNLDLQPLVEQGKFRPDLYYRLNMLKFDLPPLRQRKVDIVSLAKQFIHKFTEKHGTQITQVEDSLFNALLQYPWPGNVRELEHVIQRAVIYSRGGVLSAQNLPPHIVAGQHGPTNDPSVRLTPGVPAIDPTLGQQIALTEKDIIEQSLTRNNFSRTRTARDLGISRVTLYNKMRKYEMLK